LVNKLKQLTNGAQGEVFAIEFIAHDSLLLELHHGCCAGLEPDFGAKEP
jgi:hypothetical protein